MKEAKRLNIPVFAMVDTCCDPTDIDYVIPANDDATKSIAVVLDAVVGAIAEGLTERKLEKEKEAAEAPKKEEKRLAAYPESSQSRSCESGSSSRRSRCRKRSCGSSCRRGRRRVMTF